jgi:pyruvate/2-oxoglutarate dehydrogenase complex dihydrolipoamide acyltransferase (E2) component
LDTSLTVDHRVVNGIPAIQFMNTFYQLIEEPDGVDWGA